MTKHPQAAGTTITPNTTERRYFVFLMIYLAAMSAFGSLVNDMYLPTLPAMMRSFHTGVSEVQLGLTCVMIGLGFGEVILGPFSDKYGRKPVLIVSMIIFCVATGVCIFSPTIYFFLGCRVVQGIGASGAIMLAKSIPADLYGGRTLARVMAIIGAINGIAPAAGPVLGGFMAKWMGWKGIFGFLLLIGLIMLVVSPKLKESLDKDRRFKGSVWMGFRTYLLLLKSKPFVIHTLYKGSALGVLFAYISSAPFIIQEHYKYNEVGFAIIVGLNALAIVAGATLVMKFRRIKVGARMGAACLTVTAAVQAVALFTIDNFIIFEVALIPMLFALGMIFTVTNTMAMNDGRTEAGDASALVGLSGYVFGGIVSPLVGMGNILHSTAIAIAVLAILTLMLSHISYRLPDKLTTT